MNTSEKADRSLPKASYTPVNGKRTDRTIDGLRLTVQKYSSSVHPSVTPMRKLQTNTVFLTQRGPNETKNASVGLDERSIVCRLVNLLATKGETNERRSHQFEAWLDA